VRQLATRGAGATLFSGGAGLAIQVVATVVLARLLTPRDFGVVAMATTFSLLLSNFGLNGFTEAVVQREKIDHALASNLFWINTACGLLLTALFAAAGSLLGRFYHDPDVARVAVGVSTTIILTSISVLHLALLKRAMRFSEVSVNDIVGRIVSVVASIVLAWLGWGYWALVGGIAAQAVSITVGAWILCPWMPGLPGRAEGTKSSLAYALHTYGHFSVTYFSRNTDNLLVGWRFDAQSLGYYKKAYDLFALTASQLVSSTTVVVVAALSRVQKDAAQFRRYLFGAMAVMTFVGMWLSADLTLVGTDVIRLLLGPRWAPAGRIFTFFGPGIGAMILYGTHSWIHLAIGRADRWFRWGIIEFAVTFLMFIVALPWGPVGIAVAWTVSFWVMIVPSMWYAGKPIGLGVAPILSFTWRYIGAALLAGSLTALAMRQATFLPDASSASGALVRIIAVSAVVSVLYLGAVVLLHGGLKPLYQVTGLLRDMIPWKRASRLTPVLVCSEAVERV
jgi:polysaccharide transporter, PST family